MDMHPLMRWRMDRAKAGTQMYSSMIRFAKDEKAFLKKTLDHIRKTGPTGASAIPGSGKGEGGWWGWSKGKMTMETLFAQGLVTTTKRDKFERIYDLPERVIPSDILNAATPSEAETFRTLISLSAQALGIATEFDLRDYFRLPIAETKTAITECLENGDLIPVTVDGWTNPLTFINAQNFRAKPEAQPCSRLSIHCVGSATGPNASSTFTTGSRSIPLNQNGNLAIMFCHF
jgi:uncharacterized protein